MSGAATLSRARILVLDDNQDSKCDRQARRKPAAYAAHDAPHEPGRVGSSLRTDLSAGPEIREFAAWLGLVPPQTGGKNRLGGVSKRANQYLRRLLINGASANLLRSKATNADPWVIGQVGAALLVTTDRLDRLVATAAHHTVPTIYDRREYAAAGALRDRSVLDMDDPSCLYGWSRSDARIWGLVRCRRVGVRPVRPGCAA